MSKTNAMRMLDAKKVPYEVYTFPEEIHSAMGVSEATGIPAKQVFKTLVVMSGRSKPLLVLVPGDCELNLKRLGGVIGDKNLRMATKKEAESLTGLKTGGISALALLHRKIPTFIDQTATEFERVLVSAGRRGVNLFIATSDLIRLTGAKVVDVASRREG